MCTYSLKAVFYQFLIEVKQKHPDRAVSWQAKTYFKIHIDLKKANLFWLYNKLIICLK